MESIRAICNAEFDNLGHDLRMLILGDYIRKDYLLDIGTNNPFTQIGIVPIFETIRRSMGTEVKIGVLTGNLVILPEKSLGEIKVMAEDIGYNLNYNELTDGYVIIDHFSHSSRMVNLVTEAFQRGHIEILIGTKSLLGEGWDSPNINSLILASFVGSFMLSNQMRGRAIRIDPNSPKKTANIWHLVTIEPDDIFKNEFIKNIFNVNDMLSLNSQDFYTLERRFKTFVGPHYSRDVIENKIDRVDIIKPPFHEKGIEKINKKMLNMATDRKGMTEKWERALGEDEYDEENVYEMQMQVEIEKMTTTKVAFANNVYSILLALSLLFTLSLGGIFDLGYLYGFNIESAYILYLIALSLNGFLVYKKISIARITSPKRRLKAQAEAVFETLRYMGEIKSEDARVKIQSGGEHDVITISLVGGSLYEKTIFAESMSDLAAPIHRQKYLLIHNSKTTLKSILLATPCPEYIGRRKENVEYLQRQMKKKMIPYDIVYTRTQEGRAVLLKARKYSLKNINTALTETLKRFGGVEY